ncbi:hypothetical protein VNO77_17248 [Canavalia gladiata]|uniref:Histidine-containing phosphotransfer protein n=1 Tax=Canavalia gladiata TaxID=3824 RepID=A0AAN9LIM0_CANGL
MIRTTLPIQFQLHTTMAVAQLQRKHRDHQAAMHLEGFLDDQFIKLQEYQDESSPYFVTEILTIYFADAEKLLNDIAQALRKIPVDFKSADPYVHQLKGSSTSIGAARVKIVCTTFRSFCQAQNLEGCMRSLQQLQQEYSLLKNNIQYLFRLEQEIQAADGSIPTVEYIVTP